MHSVTARQELADVLVGARRADEADADAGGREPEARLGLGARHRGRGRPQVAEVPVRDHLVPAVGPEAVAGEHPVAAPGGVVDHARGGVGPALVDRVVDVGALLVRGEVVGGPHDGDAPLAEPAR